MPSYAPTVQSAKPALDKAYNVTKVDPFGSAFCLLGKEILRVRLRQNYTKHPLLQPQIMQSRAAYAFRIFFVATQKLIPTTAATKLTKTRIFDP